MKLFTQTMIIGASMLAALNVSASEPTIAPADAYVDGVPTITVKGDEATDTIDEQFVACRKKLAATIANLKNTPGAVMIVQIVECEKGAMGVRGFVSFLR